MLQLLFVLGTFHAEKQTENKFSNSKFGLLCIRYLFITA